MSFRLNLDAIKISEWLTDIFGSPAHLEVVHKRPWSDVYFCTTGEKKYWIKQYKRSFIEHKTLDLLQSYGKFPEVFQVNEQLRTVVYKDLGKLHAISNEDINSIVHEYLNLQVSAKPINGHLSSHPKWVFDRNELLAISENKQSFESLNITNKERLYILSAVKNAVLKVDQSDALIKNFVHTVAHGDLHADNISLDGNGSVIFLDWADSGVGYLGSSLENLALDVDNLVDLINEYKDEFKNSIPSFENEFSKKSIILKFIIGHLWRIKDFITYRNLSLEEQEFIKGRILYCCSEIDRLCSAIS